MPEEFKEPGAPDGEIPAAPTEPENPQSEAGPDTAAQVYDSHSDPYGQLSEPEVTSYPVESTPEVESTPGAPTQAVIPAPPVQLPAPVGPPKPPPPPPPPADDEDPEEEGMLRMSFMDHLGELRSRLLKAIVGVALAFILALTFCSPHPIRRESAEISDVVADGGFQCNLLEITSAGINLRRLALDLLPALGVHLARPL
jgi:hypothetical protein